MKSKIGQLIAMTAIAMGSAGQAQLITPTQYNHPVLISRNVSGFGGGNKKGRHGAQMATIRAARKSRNQRRARVANRRSAKS